MACLLAGDVLGELGAPVGVRLLVRQACGEWSQVRVRVGVTVGVGVRVGVRVSHPVAACAEVDQ